MSEQTTTERTTDLGPRRLLRDRPNGMIAGVASGVARYLGLDPVVVRLVLVLAVFAGGIGIVAYAAAWLLVPEGSTDELSSDRPRRAGDRTTQLVGGALVFVAALLVVGNWAWSGDIVVPVLFIVAGAWLVLRPRTEDDATDDDPVTDDGAAPHAGTAVDPPPPPAAAPSPPPPPPGPPVARTTSALLLLVVGGFGLAAALGADVSVRGALVAVLGLTGVGLVVGSVLGRARSLIPLGIVVLLALSMVSVADVDLSGGVGERRFAPTTVAEIDDTYRLGMGELVVDLTAIDATELRRERIEIEATMGIGSLQVIVPDEVAVTGSASASLGEVVVFGAPDEGVDASVEIDRRGREGAGAVELDLEVGVGEVQVR